MAKREAGTGGTGGRKAKVSSRSGSRKPAAKPSGAKKAGGKGASMAAANAKKAAAASPAGRAAARRQAATPRTGGRGSARPAGRKRPAAGRRVDEHAVAGVGLSDEEEILAAKYLPRDLPPRLFEEERFLFPESYHVNRVRLLVKDPDWVFAYWDVDPKSFEEIGRSVGERAMALARLSLRVCDPHHGGSTDILLPAGARWWYVRTDTAARSYRAELGVILPSGEFRSLAQSNVVTTPRVGPSSTSARRRVTYRRGGGAVGSGGPGNEEGPSRPEAGSALGPWNAPPFDAAVSPGPPGPEERPARGGASDTFRPGGASDVHRR